MRKIKYSRFFLLLLFVLSLAQSAEPAPALEKIHKIKKSRMAYKKAKEVCLSQSHGAIKGKELMDCIVQFQRNKTK